MILAVWLAWTTSAQASVPNADAILRTNENRFAQLIVRRDLEKAVRFLPLFTRPDAEQARLLAQFELMSCQPRTAQKHISMLADPLERNLFEAVLLALVSTPRPLPAVAANGGTNEKKEIFAINRGEIWRDEWTSLRRPEDPCRQMPTVEDRALRSQYRAQARALFEQLPSSAFQRDFGIVALAMDVDAKIADIPGILQHYQTQATNPYYQRLLEIELEHRNASEEARLQSKVRDDSVELSPLELKATQWAPHSIEVPILI